MAHARRSLLLAFALGTSSAAGAQYTTESFVTFQPGEVPVILTAPHGGAQQPTDVAERTASGANKSSDSLTKELTQALAARLEPLLGGKPYVVIAEFDRQYIDANREDTFVPGNAASLAANQAYNDADGRPVYQTYHGKIRQFIDEIHDTFAVDGVLFDIHGQGRFPSTAYRGTRDGRTACGLTNRHGEAALTGPRSVIGRLAAQGYDVYPPVDAPLGDPSEGLGGLNGGHTVELYGTCTGGNRPEDIDAIQIENGIHLRHASQRADYAQALANAIAGFYASFVDTDHELPPLPDVRADDLPGLTARGTSLGKAVAVGDFDHDGFDDVAAGAPGGRGMVRVFYGHAHGLTAVNSDDIDQSVVDATAEEGDELGAALAAGDFNDDGFDDLAIGSPGENDDATDDGMAVVVYGTAEGLAREVDGEMKAFSFERLSQTHTGATNESGDRFGSTLAAGDFDGDGVSDLAVGVPDEDDDVTNDGMVVVFYGSKADGLLRRVDGKNVAVSFERLAQSHVEATNEAGDRFGAALAAGDFDDDGFDDLAVGTPEENDQADNDGMVVVLYGSSSGMLESVGGEMKAVAFERLSQKHADATAENGDHFGWALAAGDFNYNGVDDLAVGVPDEDDGAADAGMVVVFFGSSAQGLLRRVGGAMKAISFERLSQRHAGATNENGDRFGAALCARDFGGDGVEDLAVGVPDEHDHASHDGMVIAFDGSKEDGLLRRVNGSMTAVGFKRLSQASLSMASEADDRFAFAIAAGDVDGDGNDDLLVGTPGEDIAGSEDSGAVYVRLGREGGL